MNLELNIGDRVMIYNRWNFLDYGVVVRKTKTLYIVESDGGRNGGRFRISDLIMCSSSTYIKKLTKDAQEENDRRIEKGALYRNVVDLWKETELERLSITNLKQIKAVLMAIKGKKR